MTLPDDRNESDIMTREAEEEFIDRVVAMNGCPRPVLDPQHTIYMRDLYARRAAERAAAAEADARYYLLSGKGRAAAARVARRMQEAHEAYIREHGLEETHAEVVRCLAEARDRVAKENHA